MRHEPDDVAGRGLFNSRPSAPQAYAQQPVQQPYVLQYGAGGRYVAAPASYAAASPYQQPYTLDAGDSCASWCSARMASATPTSSMPAAT
jgi:hypothetical protein